MSYKKELVIIGIFTVILCGVCAVIGDMQNKFSFNRGTKTAVEEDTQREEPEYVEDTDEEDVEGEELSETESPEIVDEEAGDEPETWDVSGTTEDDIYDGVRSPESDIKSLDYDESTVRNIVLNYARDIGKTLTASQITGVEYYDGAETQLIITTDQGVFFLYDIETTEIAMEKERVN